MFYLLHGQKIEDENGRTMRINNLFDERLVKATKVRYQKAEEANHTKDEEIPCKL